MVLVPAGKDNHEAVVKIVAKNVYPEQDSPFHTDKTKHIICHVDEDDLDKYKNVISKPERWAHSIWMNKSMAHSR